MTLPAIWCRPAAAAAAHLQVPSRHAQVMPSWLSAYGSQPSAFGFVASYRRLPTP